MKVLDILKKENNGKSYLLKGVVYEVVYDDESKHTYLICNGKFVVLSEGIFKEEFEEIDYTVERMKDI